MSVDKSGRSPITTSQNATNISAVSLGYVNNNFLRRVQAIDMNKKNSFNLGSGRGPNSAVKKKYLNEKFLRKDGGTMQGTLDIVQFKTINVNPAPFLETGLYRKCGLKITFYN